MDSKIGGPQMRVMRWTNPPLDAGLVDAELPIPEPGPGELLIRVHAVGVTPTERLWYPTTHHKDGSPRIGAVPGHEFSGVVTAVVGEGSDGFSVGDSVFGMNDWFTDGATAEYCLTQPAFVCAKPTGLSDVEVASVPIGALTAWQGLIERARIASGERILIHGAAGAVGLYAVQLARRAGVEIFATASAQNADFLRKLGVNRVIDYRAESFEQIAIGMDVIFDCVGGSTLERSWTLLKADGRLITIASDVEGSHEERARQAFFIVEPNAAQLAKIALLLAAGELIPFVDSAVPFADAPAAWMAALPSRRGLGKVVIEVAV
jgi:NADPH:quinone reductase-like Zn-dependent oxidoreductase